jgi:predicted phage-related endonuclease
MKEINKVELGFNAEVRKAFADFISAKATIAEATAQKEAAQEILFNAIGANNQATFGGVLAFKIVDGKNSRADLKVLAEKYPEVYTEVLRTTDYKQIRTA